MQELEEVLLAEDANYVIVLSEAFGLKRVLRKIYFYLPEGVGCSEMVKWVAKYYGDFLVPDVRLDMHVVRFGKAIGCYNV